MKDCLFFDQQILVVGKDHNVSLNDLKTSLEKDLHKENQKIDFFESVFELSPLASGLCVFALSHKAKERLQRQIKQDQFSASFFAVCVGTPKEKNNITFDEDGQTVVALNERFVHKNVKTQCLEQVPRLNEDAVRIVDDFKVLETKDAISLVKIDGGINHADEARFVMADAKTPIFGDKLYGGDTLAKNTFLALSLVELRFMHPTLDKHLMFRYYPKIDKKPWSYFKVEKFLKI